MIYRHLGLFLKIFPSTAHLFSIDLAPGLPNKVSASNQGWRGNYLYVILIRFFHSTTDHQQVVLSIGLNERRPKILEGKRISNLHSMQERRNA
jgi:hypothetical protein